MKKRPVEIKRFFLDHVLSQDKVLFNSNNHVFSDEHSKPPDYEETLAKTKTSVWIDLFHRADDYHILTLDADDMKWMQKAIHIGTMTNRLSHIFDDELETTLQKHDFPEQEGNFFVRTEKVSLKEGMHGPGPYNDLRSVIESMVTTLPGHRAFDPSDTECTVYLMKWQNIDPDKEFRVFVFQNEITAISAQHLYTTNDWLNGLTDDEISDVVHRILHFFETDIRGKLEFLESYTFDFAFVGADDRPYFIEPNSFGRHYAAGSALFHWIYDHDTLHENDVIEFRYTNEY